MAFTFGLGADNMANQFQRDATQFKLLDMSTNINSYNASVVGNAAAYVDYTFSHLNRFMDRDQENDNHATFLFEYQALLRTRIQTMITDLTAALTNDLTQAMTDARDWGDGDTTRTAMQGNTHSEVEDAGAARAAYNFFTGFADPNLTFPSRAAAANQAPQTNVYNGEPTPATAPDGTVQTQNRVSIDTQADASFGEIRAIGTAQIQQGFKNDNVAEDAEARYDVLNVRIRPETVLYRQNESGFIAHKNRYHFTEIGSTGPASSARFGDSAAQTINFINGRNTRNINDDAYDGTTDFISNGGTTADIDQFAFYGDAKNRFEKVLFETIMELDHKNLLRDIFRLSEENNFFNNVQVASTSSLATGSQMQASIFLNYVPDNANRPDLGGQIHLEFDRYSAFYHS